MKPIKLTGKIVFQLFTLVSGIGLALMQTSHAQPVQRAYLKASNTASNHYFGRSVAISGDTLVIGATLENSDATGVNGDQGNNGATNSGAAYVFVRDGTNWVQQAYLKASNTGSNDLFGQSVAISGNTIVVGAHQESSSATGVNGNQSDNSATNSGAAYVFVRGGTNWSQQAYLKASNTGAGDTFGGSVAVSGDTVVVGAIFEDSNATGVNGDQNNNNAIGSGAAYVFVRSGSNWSQQAYLKASNTRAFISFGGEVTISGDTVVVTTTLENSGATGVNGNQSDTSAFGAGAAYVFVRSGTNWSQQAYLNASNSEMDDAFGWSAAVSGDTIVLGANGEDSSARGVNGNQSNNNANNSGAAYVFTRQGTNWSQQAYLKASNAVRDESFGDSVALSGDTLLVGAIHEDSNATGVNGDQNNNNAFFSGAAYVFVRNGTNWSQQAYLKASNTDAGDLFGVSAALSGDAAVIGALHEASNGVGVDADQSDNSAANAGAAYIFRGLGNGPRLALTPDGSGGYILRFNGAPEVPYQVQRAPSVTGPWEILATNTAPISGLVEFSDINPPPAQAFYRTVQP